MDELKNYGLIYEEPKEQDWMFGASPLTGQTPIFKYGHGWLDVATKEDGEMQFNKKFDSYSCVTFTALKALSLYIKHVYGQDFDFSERFTASMSGTIPGRGNSVRAVLESIRTHGVIEEGYYPSMTEGMTEQEWFAKPPIAIQQKAKEFLAKWKINWEFIGSKPVNHDLIKDALKYSPVIMTVFAWSSQDGIYVDNGYSANHCSLGIDYDGDNILDLDTYPQDNQYDEDSSKGEFVKRLSKDFCIWSAHKITCKPIITNNKESLSIKFKRMFENLKGYMDEHGMHIWYIDDRGKQEIPMTTMAEKALFMSYLKQAIIPTTSYGAIAGLPNFKFF